MTFHSSLSLTHPMCIVPPPMTIAIHFENVEKNYDEVHALRGVDLEIPEGEFFGLLGPNGAGKTTLINSLASLVKPTKGRIIVFGQDIATNPLQTKRLIGLCPQDINMHYFMPIRKIIEFQGGFFGLSIKESKEKADDLLKRFGLWEKRDKGRYQLSGGMQRRALIMRALMGDPKILILDEPTAGLDIELRHELWEWLEMLREHKITILLTTHYIEEAERLSDRVAILHQGKVIACDSPQNLITNHHLASEEQEKLPSFVRKNSLEEVFINLTGMRIGQAERNTGKENRA